jgi:calcium/calmodulin-dependent protein kinase (CaM kinase) II
MIAKKSDGSQVKESTDSSTTLEDDDVKGELKLALISFKVI